MNETTTIEHRYYFEIDELFKKLGIKGNFSSIIEVFDDDKHKILIETTEEGKNE